MFEARPRLVADDLEDDLVEPIALGGTLLDDLDLEAPVRCVAQVHLVKVAGEQVRLFSALRPTDLHDDRTAVIGVLGQQQRLELVFNDRHGLRGTIEFPPHFLALVGFSPVVELGGNLDVLAGRAQLAIGPDDLGQLLVSLRELAQQIGIRRGGGLHQLCLHGCELCFDRVETLVHHRPCALSRSGPPDQDLGVLAFLRTP